MKSEFAPIYKSLTGKLPRELLSREMDPGAEKFIAGLCNENHIILLHTILEQGEKDKTPPSIGSGDQAFEYIRGEFADLRVDIQKRLEEFTIIWKERLEFEVLYPHLKDTWVETCEGGYKLIGEGTKDQSRKLYQQTVQDLVVEGVRILALVQGAIGRLQKRVAARWHKECLSGEISKMFFLLEEGTRQKEMEVFRKGSEFLSKHFLQLFLTNVQKWNGKKYSDEKKLFRNMAGKWASPRYASGFEGFLLFFTECLEEVLMKNHEFYYRKWRLLLRGVGPQKKVEVNI